VKGKLIVGLSLLTIFAAAVGAQVTSRRLLNAGRSHRTADVFGRLRRPQISSLQEIKIAMRKSWCRSGLIKPWLAENLKPRR